MLIFVLLRDCCCYLDSDLNDSMCDKINRHGTCVGIIDTIQLWLCNVRCLVTEACNDLIFIVGALNCKFIRQVDSSIGLKKLSVFRVHKVQGKLLFFFEVSTRS